LKPSTQPNAEQSDVVEVVVEVNMRHVISFGTGAVLAAQRQWQLPIKTVTS
jgi:hypothetical protein